MTAIPAFISIRGVTRTYAMGDAAVHALRGVDLDIHAGEFVAIVGPSGSGKTTLMYVLGLLDQPSSGSYVIDGIETAHLDDRALSRLRNRTIGYVFQQYNLLPDLSIVENIGLGQAYAGVSTAERSARGRSLAERLGLGHRLSHTPRELSGGQMQRVAIARGLACHPRLILADEPTGNLDTKTGAEIMVLLRELHAAGHTIVLVTHDPDIAAAADRTVRIVDGEIVEDRKTAVAGSRGRGETAVAESRGRGVAGSVSTDASDSGTAVAGSRGRGVAGSDGFDLRVSPPSTLSSGPLPAPSSAVDSATPRPRDLATAVLSVTDLLRMALREGLLAHKLRSVLTMLGIVFGIAAVIAMTAITEGGKQQQLEQIRRIGLNNIQVRALDLDGARLTRARRANPDGLSLDDLAAIREHVQGVVAISAWKNLKAELRLGDRLVDDALVLGVTGDLRAVADLQLGQGRFPDHHDEETFARVCTIGAHVARDLGVPGGAALGAVVVLGDEPVTVIGVMAELPGGSNGVADLSLPDRNREVYLPYTSLRAFYRKAAQDSRLDAISMRMEREEYLLPASDLIRRIVTDRHRGAEDMVVAVPLEQLRQAQRTKEIFNVIIVVIAAISLVVGGIGIMNIMLATVTERTREIGIRRAVGASQRDILRQFLAEALLLSACGGLIGLLLGLAGGWLVELVFGFPVAFSPLIMTIAVLVSGGIGVVFGLYPAWLAARMNPVEALRS